MTPADSGDWSAREAAGRQLDQACDRFEAAWLSSPPEPLLEDFLPDADASNRQAFFRELLSLDFYYRARAGSPPSPDVYLHRFPEFAGLIHEARSGTIAHVPPVSTVPVQSPEPIDLREALAGSGLLAEGGTTPAGGSRQSLGPVRVPGYEVGELLGRGAMGAVYLARHVLFNRSVAVKVILSGSSTGESELLRFRTEAEAVARLNHPGILQVYETGEGLTDTGAPAPYIAMEYCSGGSLAAKLAGNPLSPADATAVLHPLAEATQAAHTAGIIHRDLKPANVSGSEVRVWRLDGWVPVRTLPVADDRHNQTVTGLACGTDGRLALVSLSDGAIGRARLWNLVTDQVVAGFVIEGEPGRVAFSSNGRRFAVADEKRVRLYNVGGLRSEHYIGEQMEQPFTPRFCMPATPTEKPRVEKRVQDLQRQWATPVPRVADLNELNAHLRQQCLTARERTCSDKALSVAVKFEQDRAAGLSLPTRPFDACVIQPGQVDKYQTVRFDRNSCSVPRRWAFRSVSVKGYVDRVEVIGDGATVATHTRSYGSGQKILDPLHFLTTLELVVSGESGRMRKTRRAGH